MAKHIIILVSPSARHAILAFPYQTLWQYYGLTHALLKGVILNDIEWLSEIFSDMKHHVVSLQQLSVLCSVKIFFGWEWCQWCLRMMLGIKWYQFVQNDDVQRLTKQPKLTAIIQSLRLTLFWHIMHIDDNADAKRILLASPLADWRRQLGRPRITWLSTVQQDLKQHHLTLPEAADLAQNCPLWRMMSTYGATQSGVACQKRRRGEV